MYVFAIDFVGTLPIHFPDSLSYTLEFVSIDTMIILVANDLLEQIQSIFFIIAEPSCANDFPEDKQKQITEPFHNERIYLLFHLISHSLVARHCNPARR